MKILQSAFVVIIIVVLNEAINHFVTARFPYFDDLFVLSILFLLIKNNQ